MTTENGSGNGMADPVQIPVHGFQLKSADGYRLTLIVQFAKAMPYDMADAIRQGADGLNAFSAALAQLRLVRVVTELDPALSERDKPMIQPASAMPPVPRILKP